MRGFVRKLSGLPALVPAIALLAGAQSMAGSPHLAPAAGHYELATDSVSVPMRFHAGHIVVDVRVNGKGPYPFVFDTGAHGSVMDLAFAKEQGLELGAPIMVGSPNGPGRPGNLVTRSKLQIGGLTLTDLTMVAFDGLPFPREATAPRGVIGPYSLRGLLVVLDYAHERLVFRRGALPAPDGREIFGWNAAQGLPRLTVQLAGHPIEVHVDAGAMSGLSLPLTMARALPLASPPVEMGRAKLVDHESVVTGAPLAGRMTFGRYSLENPPLRFVDYLTDVGNMGPPILRQFTLTIDPANRRLRFAGPRDGKLAAPAEPVLATK